jgi:type VI secretion system protein ImpM
MPEQVVNPQGPDEPDPAPQGGARKLGAAQRFLVNQAPTDPQGVAAAGWYGKLPGLGDFAMRRLPPNFVEQWDAWLQVGLHDMPHARRACDDGALAPVRRFWLSPGVVDALAWGGLLMPSTDRAGRRFPLTVAQPMPTLAQAIAARRWFSSVVAAMRFTQGNEHTLDDFEDCLAALPPPPCKPAPRADDLLAAEILQGTAMCSAWWCHGAATAQDFRVYGGMPAPAALASLLEGPR